MDNSVRLDGGTHHARQAHAQYIARAPLSLQKLIYGQPGGKVRYHTTSNPYFSVEQEFGVWGARGKRVIRSTNVKNTGKESRKRAEKAAEQIKGANPRRTPTLKEYA